MGAPFSVSRSPMGRSSGFGGETTLAHAMAPLIQAGARSVVGTDADGRTVERAAHRVQTRCIRRRVVTPNIRLQPAAGAHDGHEDHGDHSHEHGHHSHGHEHGNEHVWYDLEVTGTEGREDVKLTLAGGTITVSLGQDNGFGTNALGPAVYFAATRILQFVVFASYAASTATASAPPKRPNGVRTAS